MSLRLRRPQHPTILRKREREGGRERVTPERVTKCLSSREERADDGAAGSLSPHTLFPSTLRRDTRVGLTDLPRNANRYTQYTQREPTPRGDTSTDALLGNVHTSEYLTRPGDVFVRDEGRLGGRVELTYVTSV